MLKTVVRSDSTSQYVRMCLKNVDEWTRLNEVVKLSVFLNYFDFLECLSAGENVHS